MIDPVVTMQATPVMYVSGDVKSPIPAQAPMAIRQIEAKLPSLRGRRCYGIVVGSEYRACVTVLAGDDPAALGLSLWEIPCGRYARRKLRDFHTKTPMIQSVFEELMQRVDYDSSRPNIEYYRSHTDLFLMAPVQ